MTHLQRFSQSHTVSENASSTAFTETIETFEGRVIHELDAVRLVLLQHTNLNETLRTYGSRAEQRLNLRGWGEH